MDSHEPPGFATTAGVMRRPSASWWASVRQRSSMGSDKRNDTEAVGLLGRIGPLTARLGREDEFAAYVGDIREANARRPAFRSLLDAAELAPSRPRLRALD